jgi:hypothetical protein
MTIIIVTALVCGTALALAVLAVNELRWHFPRVKPSEMGSSELEARLSNHEERIVRAAEQLSAHALALGLKEPK